ncbi:MAG: radical SAM protein [Victivallales bacterium]|nr:radical SAM protein [Victivallales bacterium]
MMDFQEYSRCELCPRRCGADRLAGQTGFCGESARLRIASIGPHFGEEPPLVGVVGSGTVFFTGCSTGCFFCQNHQLSGEHLGDYAETDEVVRRILEMAAGGVRNINLVTPEHFWPHIRLIISEVRKAGCDLPWVWNCSGYFRTEMLRQQADMVDIFLPDFKYADPELARLCMGRDDYPRIAMEGLKYLVDRLGFLRPFDESGEMAPSRGVLVRHLVLPGEVENSLKAIRMLYDAFGPMLPISVMRQFRPMPECFRRQHLTRLVNDREYDAVVDLVYELGFRRVFIQPDCGDPDFVPDFRQRNAPFRGNERAVNQSEG